MSATEQIIEELNKTKFGLGLMSFTTKIPEPYPQEAFNETLLATIKKNLPNKTFINGGEFYGPNDINLKYIKSFLDKYPDERKNLIISIKGAFDILKMAPKCDRAGIQASIDNILKYIPDLDIFECARVDRNVPFEETIGVLNENVDNGNIKAIGVSEASASTLAEFAKLSKHRIAGVEIEFSIFSREILENGVAKTAGELGIPIIAYSPLSSGILTGALKSQDDLPEGDFRKHLDRFSNENLEKNSKIVEFIEKAAAKYNVTSAQYSLAWVRYWSEKTINGIKFPKVIDIPSTSSVKRVEENFSDFTLTEEDFNSVNDFISTVTVHGGRYNELGRKLLSQ